MAIKMERERQCFDTVIWVTERRPTSKKPGVDLLAGDDLTGALHIL